MRLSQPSGRHATIAANPLFDERRERRLGTFTFRLTQVLSGLFQVVHVLDKAGDNARVSQLYGLIRGHGVQWIGQLGRSSAVSSSRQSAAGISRIRPWSSPCSESQGSTLPDTNCSITNCELCLRRNYVCLRMPRSSLINPKAVCLRKHRERAI